jgi:FixJ family two-component response regulator
VNDTACLITDVQMPGLSGLELQDHLIADGRALPVIFMTALAEEAVRVRALQAGAVGFFRKPCDEDELAVCLDRTVSANRRQL